jgi:hypothetical protein
VAAWPFRTPFLFFEEWGFVFSGVVLIWEPPVKYDPVAIGKIHNQELVSS